MGPGDKQTNTAHYQSTKSTVKHHNTFTPGNLPFHLQAKFVLLNIHVELSTAANAHSIIRNATFEKNRPKEKKTIEKMQLNIQWILCEIFKLGLITGLQPWGWVRRWIPGLQRVGPEGGSKVKCSIDHIFFWLFYFQLTSDYEQFITQQPAGLINAWRSSSSSSSCSCSCCCCCRVLYRCVRADQLVIVKHNQR